MLLLRNLKGLRVKALPGFDPILRTDPGERTRMKTKGRARRLEVRVFPPDHVRESRFLSLAPVIGVRTAASGSG
jgi:hypothetical protein